jgi:conjugal transfer/type IV secretion protein DotA/TraY
MTFTPPPGDQSVVLISQLFGQKWWLALTGGAEGGTFIFDLVTSLNAIALGAVGLVIGYVATNAAIATSHEGVAMGKRYHSFWVPLRSALGVGMVAPLPTAKSLCLLQAIVLLFTWYGIGFADNLYTAGLTNIESHSGSFFSEIQDSTSMRQNKEKVIDSLLVAAVNYSYAVEREGYGGDYPPPLKFTGPYQDTGAVDAIGYGIGVLTGLKSYPFAPTMYDANLTVTPPGGGSPISVGRIDVTCATPKGSEYTSSSNVGTCGVQKDALKVVWPLLVAYASRIIGRLPNQTGADGGGASIPPPPKNAVAIALHRYDKALETGVQNWINNPTTKGAYKFKKAYQKFIDSARDNGWAYAGVYSWQIMRANNYINNLLHYAPDFKKGDDSLAIAFSDNSDYLLARNAVNKLRTYGALGNGYIKPSVYEDLKHSNMRSENLGQYALHGLYKLNQARKKAQDWYNEHVAGVHDAVLGAVNATVGAIGVSGKGGVTQLKNAGDDMLDVAGILKAAVYGGGAVPVLGENIDSVLKPFNHLADMLIVIGLDLAYFIPALPFIFMVFAVLAWIIFLLEAWIAAPLWAVAHALPEGEGFAGMRAQAGYMLFLNLIIKPPLIVVGFFFAMILTNAIIGFVSKPFMEFINIMQGDTISMLYALFGLLLVYGALITFVVYKCYGLILFIPDKVPAWLGQVFREIGTHADPKQSMGGSRVGPQMGSKVAGVGGSLKPDKSGGGSEPEADNHSAPDPGSPDPGDDQGPNQNNQSDQSPNSESNNENDSANQSSPNQSSDPGDPSGQQSQKASQPPDQEEDLTDSFTPPDEENEDLQYSESDEGNPGASSEDEGGNPPEAGQSQDTAASPG